jgi:hypothetical protein
MFMNKQASTTLEIIFLKRSYTDFYGVYLFPECDEYALSVQFHRVMLAQTRNGITPSSHGNFSDVTVWHVFAHVCRRYEHNNVLPHNYS